MEDDKGSKRKSQHAGSADILPASGVAGILPALPRAAIGEKMSPFIYEVIVCSLEDALAAAEGGATRLEIISHYELGGLTPAFDLVREIVETVKLPARVMIRDEEDFTVTEEKKKESLCEAVRSYRELPIDGFVLGFLTAGQIDHKLVSRLLSCAPDLKATFHRAFEELADPIEGIAALKRHRQIDCILTSGGAGAWGDKLEAFEAWEQAARPEIGLLIGGGTDEQTIRLFRKATSLRAFHVGRAVRKDGRTDGPVQAEQVRELARLAASEEIGSTKQPK